MKSLIVSTVSCILAGLLLTSQVVAQTPDAQTPANEGTCDVLIGATPGLYGLCVAYCEAQDAHILSPGGAPGELRVPNRRILENYNKRKNESDPTMPCVQQEICPCWTAEQLSTSFPPTMNYDHLNPHACRAPLDPPPGFHAIENFETGEAFPGFQLFTGPNVRLGQIICGVTNFNYPGAPPASLQPITLEEEESCNTLLIAHANLYRIDGLVWDCFAE